MNTTWNILVVDDDLLNREIITDYLEDGPYRLQMAMDGQDAWHQLEQPDSRTANSTWSFSTA